jgi:hypothetical protein
MHMSIKLSGITYSLVGDLSLYTDRGVCMRVCVCVCVCVYEHVDVCVYIYREREREREREMDR